MLNELKLSLLGTPQINLAEESLVGQLAIREQALLYYLAVNRQTRNRSVVASLLWDDVNDKQALKNLRDVLPNLRKRLGQHVNITYQTISFNQQSLYWLDVVHFEYALKTPSSSNPNDLSKALALYRGEFLADFFVRGASDFNDWLFIQRRHLQDLAAVGWHTLVGHYIEQGEDVLGLSAVKQLLALEPWRETAHQQAMFLLAHSGQRSAALAQYAVCQRLLATELDVAPSPETAALYEQIKAGKFAKRTEAAISLSGDNQHLLARALSKAPSVTVDAPANLAKPPTQQPPASAVPQVDWSAIPNLKKFYGRQDELTHLENWLMEGGGRLVAILGMGGQGKTSLAASFVRRLAAPIPVANDFTLSADNLDRQAPQPAPFAVILWHSLLNAQPLSEILQSWLQQLSNQQIASLPPLLDQQLAMLMAYLERQRVLLVLDNLESTMQSSTSQGVSGLGTAGTFRPGYEGYQELLRRVGESEHQSCLLLTSREKPAEMTRLEEDTPYVRSLQLEGLAPAAAQVMLQAQGVSGPSEMLVNLVQRYSGNPLALTLLAQTIRDLFTGDLAAFVREDSLIFDNIRLVLDQQFARLTLAEREIMFWLAVEREPVSLSHLRSNLVQQGLQQTLLETLHSLFRRSLLEKQGTHFGLQNVVLEYFTDRLVQTVAQEIETNQLADQGSTTSPFVITTTGRGITILPAPNPPGQISQFHLNRFALVKAQAKDYVRESQVRLLLKPLAEQLMEHLGKAGVEKQSQMLLATLRAEPVLLPGYTGANLLHLLLHLDVDLRHYDFSHQVMWQTYLRGVRLPSVNFTQAAFKASSFTEPFTGIISLAFLPDSQYLAAGTTTGTIFLWRLTDHSLYQVLSGHTSVVFIAVSPNGQHLASAGADGTLRVWDLASLAGTSQAQHILCHQSIPVTAVAFNPAGDILVSANDDGTVYLWHWQTQAPATLLYKQQAAVTTLAFSPDGQLLASADQDGMIYLWDVAKERVHAQLEGHAGLIWSLAFSPDSQLLASASSDQTVRLWTFDVDGHTNQPIWTSAVLRGHTAQVYTVSFSPDGKLLASSSFDHSIRLWDIPTHRCKDVLVKHKSWVRAVAFSPDGKLLASGSNDQTICLWNICADEVAPDNTLQTLGQLHSTLIGHASFVRSTLFSPDGQLIASGHADQLVRLWNAQTGMVVHSLRGHVGGVYAMTFSPDGKLLASVGDDGLVHLWDVATGQLRQTLPSYNGALRAVAFSPDGETLAVGGNQPRLHLWDIRTGQLHRTLLAPLDTIWAVAFSPDGRYLATGTHSQGLLLWDTTSGTQQQTLDTGSSAVLSLAFHPTGELVAGGGVDRLVRLWEVKSGRLLQVLDEPTNWVFSVAFHPMGHLLAAGTTGGAIFLWTVELNSQGDFAIRFRQQLYGHSIEVTSVAFSPDGKLLVSAASDETIRLWDVETGTCLKILCAEGPYAGTNITEAQGLTLVQKAALITLGAIEDRSAQKGA